MAANQNQVSSLNISNSSHIKTCKKITLNFKQMLICPSSLILKTPDITTKKNLDTNFATTHLAKSLCDDLLFLRCIRIKYHFSASIHSRNLCLMEYFWWYNPLSLITWQNDKTSFDIDFLPAASTISWKVITIGWFLYHTCCYTIYVMGGKYVSLRPFSNIKILDDDNASWQFISKYPCVVLADYIFNKTMRKIIPFRKIITNKKHEF